MKSNIARKALQYVLINPNFNVGKIKTGALRYGRYEKPKMLEGGLTAYGRLEMYEMLPQEYVRDFLYVGCRDFDDDDKLLYERAKRWGGLTLL